MSGFSFFFFSEALVLFSLPLDYEFTFILDWGSQGKRSATLPMSLELMSGLGTGEGTHCSCR